MSVINKKHLPGVHLQQLEAFKEQYMLLLLYNLRIITKNERSHRRKWRALAWVNKVAIEGGDVGGELEECD